MKDKLPKGWEWKKLGDISVISSGNSALQDSSYYLNGTFDFIRTSDVGRIKFGEITSSNDKLNKSGFKKMHLFKKGTVLFPKSGASVLLNHRVILGKDACVSSHLATIKSINDVCEDYYLLYYLATVSAKDLIAEMSYPSLRTSIIQKILVPLPPLSEQKQIISVLDKTFEKLAQAIALIKENILKLKQLNESFLNEIFEFKNQKWETDSLKKLTIKIGSGSTPTGGQNSYKESGISLIRSLNVHDLGFREKGLAYIDDIQAKKLANVEIKKNDILLNITGASVARCCIVPNNILPARVNQHVSILRVNQELLLPKFLHYSLVSPFYKKQLLYNSSGGATREALSKAMLEKFKISYPTISEQQRIISYLDQITEKNNKLTEHYQNKLEALKQLKNSILDSAFKGTLRRAKVTKKVNVAFYQMQLIGLSIEANKLDNVAQGEMAIAKDMYLLDRLYGVPTQMNFVNHSWGPFAPEIKKGITNKQYFGKKNFPNSKATYVTVLNDGDLFKTVYPELRNQVFNGISNLNQRLFSKISPYKRAEVKELLATVLKCIEDTHSVELSVIRKAMYEWKIEQGQFKTKAEKFSEVDTQKMLQLIKKQNWQKSLII